MPKASPVLEEALRVTEFGYKLLPCNKDKRPILKKWPDAATTNPDQIMDWFSYSPYLVAVKTGLDANLFVVDVDPSGMVW